MSRLSLHLAQINEPRHSPNWGRAFWLSLNFAVWAAVIYGLFAWL